MDLRLVGWLLLTAATACGTLMVVATGATFWLALTEATAAGRTILAALPTATATASIPAVFGAGATVAAALAWRWWERFWTG